MEHFDKVKCRSVELDRQAWQPFPEALCEGDITWQLLNVGPEMGSWTAIFNCAAGSSFASHHHIGPGEYFLTYGQIDIRGGAGDGGESLKGPAYGYEACGAFHGQTSFPVESQFYMTFLGPLNFVAHEGGPSVALVTWDVAQAAWQAGLK